MALWIKQAYLLRKDLGDTIPTGSRAWRQIEKLISLYQECTTVIIGNGENVSFWKDKWTSNGPFYIHFSALYSHALRPNISVAHCLKNGEWQIAIRHITSDRTDRACCPKDLFAPCRNGTDQTKQLSWGLVITTAYWNIWLSRNHKVFDNILIPVSTVVQQCADTLKLWINRAKNQEKQSRMLWIDSWPD
ncbi:hypothetical protein BRADI_1g38490v3 [Brachypodium distachyon]|uniref:Reverse transcriptase zinc-binding domain-containing protein n=1 Tax=Brachypodium distachyon TaxID=15368 RepID=A0A2K2DNG3_BRADI|nr:hypothetical protein BRADI_1g38490v3 [Brachypodium distachyon]